MTHSRVCIHMEFYLFFFLLLFSSENVLCALKSSGFYFPDKYSYINPLGTPDIIFMAPNSPFYVSERGINIVISGLLL